MNFFLISSKITFVVILSFEAMLVSSPILLTVIKKGNQTKTVNRDHSNKNRETRVVIYTCRYSSGHFNPYNLANCPLEYLQV